MANSRSASSASRETTAAPASTPSGPKLRQTQAEYTAARPHAEPGVKPMMSSSKMYVCIKCHANFKTGDGKPDPRLRGLRALWQYHRRLIFQPRRSSMASTSRRTFMLQVAACGSALAATQAVAQPARVDEKDAQAVSLGYVHDTAKADSKKFPKHTKDQKCNNCALYQGKAADAWAGCPLFGAKQVAGAGWCSAWAKKG